MAINQNSSSSLWVLKNLYITLVSHHVCILQLLSFHLNPPLFFHTQIQCKCTHRSSRRLEIQAFDSYLGKCQGLGRSTEPFLPTPAALCHFMPQLHFSLLCSSRCTKDHRLHMAMLSYLLLSYLPSKINKPRGGEQVTRAASGARDIRHHQRELTLFSEARETQDSI